MSRGIAYTRDVRNRSIERKKRICREVKHDLNWYKFDGQYSKGKIHCGCGICKPSRRFGYPTLRTERELQKFNLDLREFTN